MPKNYKKVIAVVNALTIDPNSPLLVLRSNKRPLETDQAPGYTRSELAQDSLGTKVLSLFGGADVSALKCPEVSDLFIIDSNPICSKQSIIDHCTEEDYEGLFHKAFGLFILAYSPYLYATMSNHSDFDSPYNLVNLFRRQCHEYLDDPQYLNDLNLPSEDGFFNFISQNSQRTPSVDPGDIGLSTLILLRLRFCLGAEILSIEELEEDRFVRVTIKKSDGSQASLYYASCTFGGGGEDNDRLARVSAYIKQSNGGVSSVLIRGYPTFFNGKLKGDEARIAVDMRSFIDDSKAGLAEELKCVVCTIDSDYLPNMFINNQAVVRHVLPKVSQYDEQEVVYTCTGTALGLQSKPTDVAAHTPRKTVEVIQPKIRPIKSDGSVPPDQLERKECQATVLSFKNSLEQLFSKIAYFDEWYKDTKKKRYQLASQSVSALHKVLAQAGEKFMLSEQSQNDYEVFKSTCKNAITIGRKTLDKYRDCKKIVMNILGLLVLPLYLFALVVDYAKHRRVTFFATDSSLKVSAVEDTVGSRSKNEYKTENAHWKPGF